MNNNEHMESPIKSRIELFAGCSSSPVHKDFELGDTISCRRHARKFVYIIVKGQARLIIHDNSELFEVYKLGTGDLIGAASVITGIECEEVVASTPVSVIGVEVSLFNRTIKSPDFRVSLLSCLLPAETCLLLRARWEREYQHLMTFEKFYHQAKEYVSICTLDNFAEKSHHECLINGLVIDAEYAYGAELSLEQVNAIRLGSESGIARILLVNDKAIRGIAGKKANGLEDNGIQLYVDGRMKGIDQEVSRDNIKALKKISLADGRAISFFPAKDKKEEVIGIVRITLEINKVRFREETVNEMVSNAYSRNQNDDLSIVASILEFHGLIATCGHITGTQARRLECSTVLLSNDRLSVVFRNDVALGVVIPRDGIFMIDRDTASDFLRDYKEFIYVQPGDQTPQSSFEVGWFLPYLSSFRSSLMIVLVASLVVQLLGLASPLLFQIIIDKVISQRSLDTLQVLGYALVVVTLLEGTLGSARTFLFAQVTNKLDQRIGTKVIDHLLRLPLNYFDSRPVGELSSRLDELEKIRTFLTSQVLTTVLDSALSVIYVIAMVLYSLSLTMIALSVVPVQILITILGAPIFRLQYRESAQRSAKTQSHLVEVLTGIQTVKSQSIESSSRSKWQHLYARYIQSSFNRIVTSTAISESTQVLQKLSQLFVLWYGASLVLEGKITLGQLIAFRIVSGYVTQPLLRLSTTWQTIQELRISFERLADIMDTPQELSAIDGPSISMPPIQGAICFENVTFKFPSSKINTIVNMSLSVSAGNFVGIVGKSGSGKSTLAKLIAKLYSPCSGRITIDEIDITKVELNSLRRQIGIVPQEPLLFAGSIYDNIALCYPNSESTEIVRAAKLACAHDFIMELPQGYQTDVGERGLSLSGGQRQRIALARSLVSTPRILILDEATSALDYSTENQVFRSIIDNLSETTIVFITHRLTNMPLVDQVVMMENGVVLETGSHSALMSNKNQYFDLFKSQGSVT